MWHTVDGGTYVGGPETPATSPNLGPASPHMVRQDSRNVLSIYADGAGDAPSALLTTPLPLRGLKGQAGFLLLVVTATA